MADVSNTQIQAGQRAKPIVDKQHRLANYDYAFGGYLYKRYFYDELSRFQEALMEDEPVEIYTGEKLTLESPGDMIAVDMHMKHMDAEYQVMVALEQKGIKAERDSLTSH